MIHFLQRIFAFFGVILSSKESEKISISWALKFVLHMSTVLGFTVILALFVGGFGVHHLPELFGVEALFSILGTLAFASFLKKLSQKKALLVGSIMLFLLSIVGFAIHNTHLYIFFGILIFGYSVVITQLNIIFSLFVEEMFSPLESERAFPLIESAEPVGGIFAGLITGLGILIMNPEHFVLTWGILILLIIPLIIMATHRLERVPKPHSKKDHIEYTNVVDDFKISWFHISNNPFLKTLFFLVFVQFMVFNLIEFQYSTAATEMFSHAGGELHEGADVISAELAHGLGLVHIVLYTLLLIFQLFFASKIQKKLGVVRTIFLHPLMVFFASVIMALKFTFFSTVLAKGTFEIFGGPSRNAYHSSFYAFRPHVRQRAKEFLEGVARPLGMLMGTLFILIIQWGTTYFQMPDGVMSSTITFLILLFLGGRYLTSSESEEKYTLLARKNLETRGGGAEKLDAIQILAQRGHKNATNSLLKVLHMRNENLDIKISILRTLGHLRNPDAIPDILKSFESNNKEIQCAALESLAQYKNLGEHFLTQSFAKHRVIQVLQNIFIESQSKSIKKLVIEVFQNIKHPEIIPFLLESLKSEENETVLGAIRVCGMFKDLSSAHYLEPFLDHPNLEIKASAIIAMWSFTSYRLRLTVLIASLFESHDSQSIETAIYVVGEIKGIHEFKRLLTILQSTENINIKKHIYVALAKMEHSVAVQEIVNMILNQDKEFSLSVRKLIFAPSVAKNIKKAIQYFLEESIADKIHTLLRNEGEEILENMKLSTLDKLYDAYMIIGEKKEMMKIDEIRKKRLQDQELKDLNTKEDPREKNLSALGSNIVLDDLL